MIITVENRNPHTLMNLLVTHNPFIGMICSDIQPFTALSELLRSAGFKFNNSYIIRVDKHVLCT